MKSKIFVDTNILIYGIDKKSKYYEYSNMILNEYVCCITSKNVTEFVNVLSKNKGIDYLYILKKFNDLFLNFRIYYHDKTSVENLKNLVEKYKPKGNRIFDIEIIAIMLACGINKIATINEKDFENIEEVEIISIG